MKKDLFIFNSNSETPQILIHGYIGEGEKVDYSTFKQNLDVIKKQSNKAHIDIHCGGGDMFDGLAIYDLLVNSGIDYSIHIAGIAASMGSILGIAAPKEKTTISENAMFMTHKPKAGVWGESDEIRNIADLCDKLETRIKDIYKVRTGLNDAEIDNWIKPNINNWINAQDAVKFNLVGKVIPSTVKSTIDIPTNKSQQEMWAIYNTIQNQNSDTMNQLKLSAITLAILSLNIQATESDIDVAVKKLSDDKKILEDKLIAFNKANAETLITNAIKEKKIKEADKESWLKMALNDFSTTSMALAGIQGVVLPTDQIRHESKVTASTDTDNWTLKDWQLKNPQGLVEMKNKEPEKYVALAKAAMETARNNINEA